ncbi:hypothetical protein ACVIYL_008747 [Bradyrhizobium sp. USDA 3315]
MFATIGHSGGRDPPAALFYDGEARGRATRRGSDRLSKTIRALFSSDRRKASVLGGLFLAEASATAMTAAIRQGPMLRTRWRRGQSIVSSELST